MMKDKREPNIDTKSV